MRQFASARTSAVLKLGLGIAGVTSYLLQTETNGRSTLGTFEAPKFPRCLPDALGECPPWKVHGATKRSQGGYEPYPTTAVVRSYNFTVSRGLHAPDGHLQPVMLVNGAFPGPTIEANWGDTIEVTVYNNLSRPYEGVALHWHGFLQKDAPWEDGVPAVTQCPISPGSIMRYRFHASLYGTSWYHSHYSAQYVDGMFGAIIVYGPSHVDYDVDIGPVMLNDWYHRDYFMLMKEIFTPGHRGVVFSENNLINGKMTFDCSISAGQHDAMPCTECADISKFRFKRGKTHRLRFINSGAEAVQRISIDEHIMTVIAYDYVPVVPYNATVVTLGVGQRADVIVLANVENVPSGAFWLRANMTKCSLTKQPFAVAAVYYDDAPSTEISPNSIPWDVPDPGNCANDPLDITKPMYPIPLADPTHTEIMTINSGRNASNISLWMVNNQSYRGNYNTPSLLVANAGNTTYLTEWNVFNFGSHDVVRVVLINNSSAAHPIHLHGFNMVLLWEGPGLEWNGTIVNKENPMRRDVQMVRANGVLVLQFDAADNPGMWPFHCHIAWHASAGFFAQFLTGSQRLKEMQIPERIRHGCHTWEKWTHINVLEQIDSGL